MKPLAFLIPLTLLFMGHTCEKEPAEEMLLTEPSQETQCPQDLVCTEVFVSVHAHITNSIGEAVVLDSFYSKNIVSGEKYTWDSWQGSEPAGNGYYPILTDSQLRSISADGTPIEFVGFKNGKEVVNRVFVIGHDCCHIKAVTEDLEIKLSGI
ncbi:hypothetical protein [Cesiribacter sp. SM1]|uniref:hypothetical protein n=1 Tax=Cesiribacter sp. SM1 TaxID=2861196 RepID=UPI001CD66956|nr:hypothetical protein [Cesiribacter sp. SM1]